MKESQEVPYVFLIKRSVLTGVLQMAVSHARPHGNYVNGICEHVGFLALWQKATFKSYTYLHYWERFVSVNWLTRLQFFLSSQHIIFPSRVSRYGCM